MQKPSAAKALSYSHPLSCACERGSDSHFMSQWKKMTMTYLLNEVVRICRRAIAAIAMQIAKSPSYHLFQSGSPSSGMCRPSPSWSPPVVSLGWSKSSPDCSPPIPASSYADRSPWLHSSPVTQRTDPGTEQNRTEIRMKQVKQTCLYGVYGVDNSHPICN